MRQKIKIVSGWSNHGGSTWSLMELCDLFNERGLRCAFYGPHEWHLDKCSNGKALEKFSVDRGDIVIGHFMRMPNRLPGVKKLVLSCHEKTIFPIQDLGDELAGYDKIRFISEDQKQWHNTSGTVILNLVRGVKETGNNPEGVAGVIGTVCPMKRTSMSAERALADGFEKVLIYGNTLNEEYFNNIIKPMLGDKVEYRGLELDKQKMYDSLSCVYQSNGAELPEAFGRVKAECIRAGIPYHGNENSSVEMELWDEDKIFDAWKEFLEI